MKKLSLISLILMILVVACNQDDESPVLVDQKKSVTLSFKQEGILINDYPPSSRTESSEEKTYLLIRVTDVTNGVYYANGVFEDITSEVELQLLDGRSYEVEAVALKKGETYGLVVSSNSSGKYFGISSGPYITDSITYSDYNLSFGTFAYYTNADSSTYSSSPLPPLQTFYTNVAIDDVNNLPDLSNILLVNNTFGIDATIDGNYSGSIRIKLSYNNLNPAFTKDIHNTQDPNYLTKRSFFIHDLRADSSFWSESYKLEISHLDTIDNIPLTDVLYDSYLPFKRLHLKTILINAPADTSASGSSGFTFVLEDTEMISGDTLIVN